jgi:hypothetical protein
VAARRGLERHPGRVQVVPQERRGRRRVGQRLMGVLEHDPRRRAAPGERPRRVGEQQGGPLHRAQRRLGHDRHVVTERTELAVHELLVEGRVVGHEHAPDEQRRERSRDLRERGRGQDIRRADPVDVLRAEVALRVDERGPGRLDLTARRDLHDGDLHDAVMAAREQPRGLDVDDGVPSHDTATPLFLQDRSARPTAELMRASGRSCGSAHGEESEGGPVWRTLRSICKVL